MYGLQYLERIRQLDIFLRRPYETPSRHGRDYVPLGGLEQSVAEEKAKPEEDQRWTQFRTNPKTGRPVILIVDGYGNHMHPAMTNATQ